MQETPKKKKRKENRSPSCKSEKALTFKVEEALTACRQPIFSRLEAKPVFFFSTCPFLFLSFLSSGTDRQMFSSGQG
jgi:hypothetical protein